MKIGIIGLGLIGGSMAKAIRLNTEHYVMGMDIDPKIVTKAKIIEAINEELTEENIGECDMILLALYPEATIATVEKYGHLIKPGAYVIDCGGVKEKVCSNIPEIAKKYGFIFVGGHPMAGIEKIGFKYSNAEIFADASMILTPDDSVKIEDLANIKIFFLSIGFGKITVKTAEDHDRIIAYTSQLAHVLSNAYVKSQTAKEHKGLSAGSFKDLTRVAYLNETMWTELFLENKTNLINEISTLIFNLAEYKTALEKGEADKLKELLKQGREIKEALDNE